MEILLQDVPTTPLIMKDYLNHNPSLTPFYTAPFSIEQIQIAHNIKRQHYSHRNIWVEELNQQMNSLDLSPKQKQNLELLQKTTTCTITTGHQLNLLGGPVFSFYKILQIIETAQQLNSLDKELQYVPIFWMASEDHDFLEINHFNFKNQSYHWNTQQKGAVGNYHLEGLSNVMEQVLDYFKGSNYFREIKQIIEGSYLSSSHLSEAHRKLIHGLLKEYGILILDGNTAALKKMMIPYFEKEILEQSSFKTLQPQAEKLQQLGYKIQVNPREINLFYFSDYGRNRIEKHSESFYIIDTPLVFSKEEILKELHSHPEKFSPNALLRPFYQEVILPNVLYIGGNAEIAYWLELQSFFEENSIPFPLLQPRNSILIYGEKEENKLQKIGLELTDFLQPKNLTEQKIIQNFSMVNLELEEKKESLNQMYQQLITASSSTDPTLKNLIEAQKKKQLKAFDALEKRLLKAEKRVHSQKIASFHNVYETIYPSGSIQERQLNFLEYYNQHGSKFFQSIKNQLNWKNPVLKFIKF